MARNWSDLDAKIQPMVNAGVPIRRIAGAYNIPYSTVRSRYCKSVSLTFSCRFCGASVTIDQRKDARKKFCSVDCRDHYFTCKRRKNKQRYIDRVANDNTVKRV